VEVLGAERVGHGIAAIADPAVMALVAERRIPLEICPTSNLRTGALARLRGCADRRTHPVAELFRAGVPVTLATDDPAMFQTELHREYAAAADAGLDVHQLEHINEEGFAAAFLPATERDILLERFREYQRAQGLVY
jgi:aminodeoxyfutalosine deaminase